MSKEIQVLKQTELLGQQFSVYGTVTEPLFIAKDVASWIGHSDVSTMLRNIDEDEKLIQTIFVSGQGRDTWMLTPSGVYEVLMQSRKPVARQFKKGVKHILEEIRLSGAYVSTSSEESDEELMARALAAAERAIKRKEERIKQLEKDASEQQALIEQKDETIEAQEQQIKKSAPKVNYYDEHLQSVNTVTTTQVAKEIGMEANRLNHTLREAGLLYKQSGQWLLKAPYCAMGLHSTRTQTFTRSDGSIGTSCYTVWTQRGRMFIIRLKENNWNMKDVIKTMKGE